ncbi:restriction endonuclease subunit S [Pasteurella atlantica]|uniref:Restriction endonuclease subunit S n=2 Tax=Pasteurellaceae TaxID=712 RepID=A0ACC6HPV7_9PAST|nr:restriction endonuclease subunit S [Pasteurella atlantica]MDP8052853.1 restriction endonuclease subunit S [Pasteurella atlantica]MDP8105661.1 restriction endonuclease subunit S [Pasteurella atlantica]MDP8148993.1 restriction endonuclease subunit S [Pasteurella atlantica]
MNEELGQTVSYKKGFAFKSKYYQKNGIPIIRVSDFTDDSISLTNVNYLDITKLNEIQSVELLADDIVIATVGSWANNPQSIVGKVIRVPKKAEGSLLNQNAVRLRSNRSDEQIFLYYALKSKDFSNFLLSTAQGSANQASITLKSILSYKLPMIEHSSKIKIGNILNTLDQKIQLNTETNQTLENIAQAIFKSWFIDFDPVHTKANALANGDDIQTANRKAMMTLSGKTDTELTEMAQQSPTEYAQLHQTAQAFPSEFGENGLPLGWEMTTFGKVSQCFDSKRVPLSKRQRAERQGNIPYYGATSVMDYVNDAIFDDTYLLIGEDGSVLKENGTPFIQYIWGKSWVNNHAHVLQGIDSVSTEQLMLFMQDTDITPYVTGAVQLKLNQKNMNSIPFIKATEKINNLFNEYISPFYKIIKNNLEKSRNLERIRNILLPKLLTGNYLIYD